MDFWNQKKKHARFNGQTPSYKLLWFQKKKLCLNDLTRREPWHGTFLAALDSLIEPPLHIFKYNPLSPVTPFVRVNLGWPI